MMAQPALAATITVTKQADSNDGACTPSLCSLYDAFRYSSTGDTIVIPAGTYPLTNNDLRTDHALTVTGAGPRSTIIDGVGAHNVGLYPPGATPFAISISGVRFTRLDDPSGNGAIDDRANLSLSDSQIDHGFSGSEGGGIATASGTTTSITRTTIADNQVPSGFNGGAGISVGGTVTISNSTITGNDAGTDAGGGIENYATLTLINTTVADNSAGSGGGISGGNVTFENTIVADNSATNPANANCSGVTTTTDGGNIDSQDTCAFHGASDKHDTSPQLQPLADNGGPTDTMAIPAGSPARGAAVLANCPSVDQRGLSRANDGDAGCDAGAFEFQVPPANTSAPTITGTPAVGQVLQCATGAWSGATPQTYSFVWVRDGSPISGATGSAYTVVPADQGHGLVCQVMATGPGGSSTASSAGVFVPAPTGPGPGPGPGGGTGTALPTLVGSVTLAPTVFRAASAGPSATTAARRRPIGTRVSYRLDVAGSVRFTILAARAGRRGGRGRCVAPSRRNRRARRCTRMVALRGQFTRRSQAGRTSFRFTGRLNGRRLAPGRYRLVATPVLGRRAGRARSAAFRIVR